MGSTELKVSAGENRSQPKSQRRKAGGSSGGRRGEQVQREGRSEGVAGAGGSHSGTTKRTERAKYFPRRDEKHTPGMAPRGSSRRNTRYQTSERQDPAWRELGARGSFRVIASRLVSTSSQCGPGRRSRMDGQGRSLGGGRGQSGVSVCRSVWQKHQQTLEHVCKQPAFIPAKPSSGTRQTVIPEHVQSCSRKETQPSLAENSGSHSVKTI